MRLWLPNDPQECRVIGRKDCPYFTLGLTRWFGDSVGVAQFFFSSFFPLNGGQMIIGVSSWEVNHFQMLYDYITTPTNPFCGLLPLKVVRH